HAKATIIARGRRRTAMVNLTREDRTITGFVHAAEFLHHRRRQPDLVAGDGAAPLRRLDLLKPAPDRVSLVEVDRIQFGGQYLDRPAAAEQFHDSFGLLPYVEIGHSKPLRFPGEIVACRAIPAQRMYFRVSRRRFFANEPGHFMIAGWEIPYIAE